MSGLGISDLPWPADEWRVDLHSRGFETPEKAAREDKKRARMLRKWAKCRRGKRRERALALADILDPAVMPIIPKTPASSRGTRQQRIPIFGAVWQAVAEDPTGKVARFDVIKPSWACSLNGLLRESPLRIRAEFRADLKRAAKKVKPGGASACKGFVFAALHGDFETRGKIFELHFHLVATGDWIAVVNELRDQEAYKPTKRVNTPIRERKKLNNLAYALTYLVKAYWSGAWAGPVSGQTNDRRSRGHFRIPEPFHSQHLLWLHQWKLQDMILMMNICVRKEGLVVKSVHE